MIKTFELTYHFPDGLTVSTMIQGTAIDELEPEEVFSPIALQSDQKSLEVFYPRAAHKIDIVEVGDVH